MKLRNYIAMSFGCGLIAIMELAAQSAPQQAKPQNPPPSQPQKPPADANPFPEDTGNIPVVPTSAQPAAPAPEPNQGQNPTTTLLKTDVDPAHSPDDPLPSASDSEGGFSSSLTGGNDVNIPDEEPPASNKRSRRTPAIHQETAKEDEDVGAFELSRKNWKAALSRFQSALVTDSENPEVYWGIAEAQRQLGDYPNAKANYQKVVDFDDPESKHSREAKKLLKSPQLAKAPAQEQGSQLPR